jgi:glycerophosphoryl diester phosphodiesterase
MKPARFLHLVAHRGDAASCPENTLPAFQSALDLGVRFVDVDVQISANGVPVATRNTGVRVNGQTFNVDDLTAAELAQADASQPERFGERFNGTGIPRLVDVLSLVTKRPGTTVFATISRSSLARYGHDQVVAQVAEALKPFRSRCIFVCEDVAAVHRARQVAHMQIGWVLSACDSHTRIKYEALQPEFLFCDRSLLTGEDRLWRGPWRWVVREVNSIDDAIALAERGVDFVATADVRALSEAMRARAAAQARPQEMQIGDESTTIARSSVLLDH